MTRTREIPTLEFDPGLGARPPLRAALLWGFDLPGCPASREAFPWLAELLLSVREAGESFLPAARKAAVRGMLRHGAYKPAGRAKPSSEYLLSAALDGEAGPGGFPLVNGPVDANNAVSLAFGLPASIFDLEQSGHHLLLRRGGAGESYVFNPSGQRIDLEDLLVVCRRLPEGGWEACGNPVKDAMATKVFAGCRDVVAVVYAPSSDPRDEAETCARQFCDLLRDVCGAAETGYAIVG